MIHRAFMSGPECGRTASEGFPSIKPTWSKFGTGKFYQVRCPNNRPTARVTAVVPCLRGQFISDAVNFCWMSWSGCSGPTARP